MIFIGIKLSNEVIRDVSLSNEGFAVYCALRMVFPYPKHLYLINGKALAYYLSGHNLYDKRLYSLFSSGLEELIERNMVLEVSNDRYYQMVDVSGTFPNGSDKFTLIEEDEIHNIINLGGKVSLTTLRIFCIYMSWTKVMDGYNKTIRIGFQPIEKLQSYTELSYNPFIDHTNILEQNEILALYRPMSIEWIEIDKKKQRVPKGISNTYGRFKDREVVQLIGETHLKEKMKNSTNVKKQKKQTQALRSYIAQHNAFIKNPNINYTITKKEEIYNCLREWNFINKDDSFKKAKDLSVYKQYNFYKGEGV